MRDTVAAPRFTTQTAPAPTATALGPSPTGIVVAELDAVSIRVTTSSSSLRDPHAPRLPRRSRAVERPTEIVLTTLIVRGFMRATRRSLPCWPPRWRRPDCHALGPIQRSPMTFGPDDADDRSDARDEPDSAFPNSDRARIRPWRKTVECLRDGVDGEIDLRDGAREALSTQTNPSPTASPVGVESSAIDRSTSRVVELMRVTDSSSRLPTQTAPSPAATAEGRDADGNGRPGRRSTRGR